jgi:hypothetical protein
MLAVLAKIGRQIAALTTTSEAKDLRDKAEAVRVYARQQKGCRDIERQAAIVRIQAERRLGKLLATSVKAGNPNCKPGGQLPEGITRNQSSDWQQIARIPEREFQKYLEGRNPTTKGAVALGRQHQRKVRNAKGPDTGGQVFTGDMWQLHSRLEDGSVDLFLTDPPYGEPSEYGRLAELAALKLKDGGLCVAYTDPYRLPEVMQAMGEHLGYWWTIAIALAAAPIATKHLRRVQNAWRPVVLFAKGKPSHAYFRDCIQGGKPEKDLHDWQQSQFEAEHLIERFTAPGELVVDPYCGSGTTLAAAKELGRRWIGTELDANTAKGARRRVA